MIHQVRYHGWLVCTEPNSVTDEYDTQTGLLPWGMSHAVKAVDSSVHKGECRCGQSPKRAQGKKAYKSISALNDEATESNRLIGTKEIASTLGMSTRQIQRLVKKNKLPPPVPHNKNLLWIREDFSNWLNNEI